MVAAEVPPILKAGVELAADAPKANPTDGCVDAGFPNAGVLAGAVPPNAKPPPAGAGADVEAAGNKLAAALGFVVESPVPKLKPPVLAVVVVAVCPKLNPGALVPVDAVCPKAKPDALGAVLLVDVAAPWPKLNPVVFDVAAGAFPKAKRPAEVAGAPAETAGACPNAKPPVLEATVELVWLDEVCPKPSPPTLPAPVEGVCPKLNPPPALLVDTAGACPKANPPAGEALVVAVADEAPNEKFEVSPGCVPEALVVAAEACVDDDNPKPAGAEAVVFVVNPAEAVSVFG